MLDAADAIAAYTHGASETIFLADRRLQDAVHWNFAIIGEALAQLRDTDAEIAEKISEWRRIIGLRNQLIHGYRVVQAEITWNIVEQKLPILRGDLKNLLGS